MASIALVIGAYLLGSIPQVYWMICLKGAAIGDDDLHEQLWNFSHRLGAIGFTIDLAKGTVVILAGKWAGLPLETIALAGLLVVIGQMWPVYLLRSGGGGNSTAIIVAATLAVQPFLIALIPVFASLGWRIITHLKKGQSPLGPPHSQSVPLGMFIAFATLPLASWLLKEPLSITLSFLGMFIAIMVRRFIKGFRREAVIKSTAVKRVLRHLIFD